MTFPVQLRLFVFAAVSIRVGSLNLPKTFDAAARGSLRPRRLSDLTTGSFEKRRLFDVDGHSTHLVWIFKVFRSHIVSYRGSFVSSAMR